MGYNKRKKFGFNLAYFLTQISIRKLENKTLIIYLNLSELIELFNYLLLVELVLNYFLHNIVLIDFVGDVFNLMILFLLI